VLVNPASQLDSSRTRRASRSAVALARSCACRATHRAVEHPEFRAHLVSCVQLRRVAAAVV